MRPKATAHNLKATYSQSVSNGGKDSMGRFFAYCIHPPKNMPFLPSEEAVIMFVESHPEITYLKVERLPDRDILLVKVRPTCNIFRSHATADERALCRLFLQDIAVRAEVLRDIPAYVQEACHTFLLKKCFLSLTWKPNDKGTGGLFECVSLLTGPIPAQVLGLNPDPDLRTLTHLCTPYPAFAYEAAPV